MDELLSQSLLTSYYLVLGVLALFGGHRLVLLVLYYRTRNRAVPLPAEPREWPRVTVQLPLFNELYVAKRLIDAVAALDYPADRLQIQVLDDGFKAGALAAGVKRASGSLLVVFDADFVPQADFLKRTVPHFADPEIGMVQACWEHLNREYSLLTRIQAIFLDAHFLIEHAARNRSGRFFNFNGTAGIWRRQAIEDAGGWQHDTLTEDLDLSYRAQLAGWRFLFLPEVKVPAELPVEINAFKRQQYRWAKGSIQTARKLLGRVLRAPIPARVKLEAAIHLTNNVAYLLMIGLSLLIFPAMWLRIGTDPTLMLYVDLPLFLGATVSVLVYYTVSQFLRDSGGEGWARRLPALMGLGIGLAVNNARAVLSGFRKEVGVFERTPKYSIEQRSDRWRGKRYRVPSDLTFLIEGAFALFFIGCFIAAIALEMWPSLPFLYLFLTGYCYMFLLAMTSNRPPRAKRPLTETGLTESANGRSSSAA
jgi:hypothetical protein